MTVHTRSSELLALHGRMLRGSPAMGQYIEDGSGRSIHVIEAGTGAPLLLVHGGGGQSALQWLPLVEHLQRVRALAVDRPGFGLSDPVDLPREHYRTAVVEWLDGVLDALGLEATALLGNSLGGAWALWYALARPDRVGKLVLVGSPPGLPGTRIPAILRMLALLLAIPGGGVLLSRLMRLAPESVVQQMWSVFGESETRASYPEQVEALVAAVRDPVAGTATMAEGRTTVSPLGFRRSHHLTPEELHRIRMPTLLVWGEDDPFGATSVARATAEAIPGARLELLPAGHAPWLGHPRRTAELIAAFVR